MIQEIARQLDDESIAALSLETAVDYRDQILKEMQSIEAMLGTRRREHTDGTVFTPDEYHSWRRRAIDSKNHFTTIYRKLKKHCQLLRNNAAVDAVSDDIDPHDSFDLLRAMHSTVSRLARDGARLTKEELNLSIAAEVHIAANS